MGLMKLKNFSLYGLFIDMTVIWSNSSSLISQRIHCAPLRYLCASCHPVAVAGTAPDVQLQL